MRTASKARFLSTLSARTLSNLPSNEPHPIILFNLTSAQLPLSKITKYSENYEENTKVKRKNLPESVKIADRIVAGETSYEGKSLSNFLSINGIFQWKARS